jgi:hypothetical protein
MLDRIDALSADIAALDARIEALIGPFAQAVDRLDEIPGVGQTAAHLLIAEIGVDMTRFPTAGHLVSWAKYAPGVNESAGKRKGTATTGHGNPYLARVLGEAAVAASKTDSFLGERYRRIARRRGKQRAIVAVGRSILVIAWHLLSDPEAHFHDLGAGFYDTRMVPTAPSATTSVSWRPSGTRSSWNPPPDPAPIPPAWTRLRCAAPGAAACPRIVDFRIRPPWPGAATRDENRAARPSSALLGATEPVDKTDAGAFPAPRTVATSTSFSVA